MRRKGLVKCHIASIQTDDNLSIAISKILRLPKKAVSTPSIISAIRNGFSVDTLNAVKSYLNMDDAELYYQTHISVRSVVRRKRSRLTTVESDRVYRLAKMTALTTMLFCGNRHTATGWLKTSNRSLGDVAPLDLATTEPGYEEVVNLIGRLEHGVF